MKRYLTIAGILFLAACNSSSKEEKEKKDTDTSITKTDTTTPPPSPPVSGKIDIETFGDIKIGQPYTETIKILGKPDTKSHPIEWEADGLMHEDWTYKSKGLELNMASEILKPDSTRVIFSITAKSGSDFKTKANMGIGNTYEEVQEAYKRDIDTTMSDKSQIVVGSVYGGIIFSFGSNGKVSRIFLGAAAE